MSTEVDAHASFTALRYAQCWEDADVLVEALDVQPGDTCLSIASAGDNALSLLAEGAGRVIAVDISQSQLACVELRVAALRELDDGELRQLIGSDPGGDREGYYRRCRTLLSPAARDFWDARADAIRGGVGDAGRFEGYFRLFRSRVLPLVHSRATVEALVSERTREEREQFYDRVWDNRRWRWMFGLFFSRFVMGRLGRDPGFFRYVEGSVAERILRRTRHALTVLDPSNNPYVQWILFGRHLSARPHWLRDGNIDRVRASIDRLEWRRQSVEDFLGGEDAASVRRFNLSDIFEYMSLDAYGQILAAIVERATPGTRLAYWNLLAPRRRLEALADRIRPLDELARSLHERDKAFFYGDFVVEEVGAA